MDVSTKHEQETTGKNPLLDDMESDILYHIGLSSGTQDLQKMFGDVKVINSKFV